MTEPQHGYLSTACVHAQHDYCKNAAGSSTDGTRTMVKEPGKCKFCAAPCICACHQEGTP